MKWQKTSEELTQFLEDKLKRVDCQSRRMFGCPAYFINDNMFIGAFKRDVFIRLSPDDKEKALKKYSKPIVCNEDDKVGDEAVLALQACVDNGCSWGFMHKNLNQYQPFEFNGYDDDRKVYDRFKQVISK